MASEMTDATEDSEQNDLPVLKKARNGWFGKGENLRVVDNIIKIKKTDAHPSHVPSEEQRQMIVDKEGNFSQHVQLAIDDHLYQLWMSKIGPYLGDWVLGKGRNVSPPWKLRNFPDGYTLWIHKAGVSTDRANPRIDAYLHGAPHLGPTTNHTHLAPTIFRSPMEFVEHAIWLMKGLKGQCLCKYCMPGQSQKAINRRLNHGMANDSDPESDEDDEDDNSAGAGAGNASRSRGGGRGGRAAPRRPRVRREPRDRSPPIMAKDYRVGNRGAGPA